MSNEQWKIYIVQEMAHIAHCTLLIAHWAFGVRPPPVRGEGRVRGHANSNGSGSLGQLQEPPGHLRPLAFLLVLEKDERVPPVLLTHPLPPRLQLRIAIIGTPQPQIAPIRS